MRRVYVWALVLTAGTVGVYGQTAGTTNTVGIEFVLIRPGKFTVGRFQPPYPRPGASTAGIALYAEISTAGDSNGDLRLTLEEMRTLAGTWFDRIDGQRTGQVSREQFQQGFATMQPQASGRRGGGVGGNTLPLVFDVADTNRDGSVSRPELGDLFARWFEAWDTGKTGSVTSNQVLRGLNAALPTPPTGGAPAPTEAARARGAGPAGGGRGNALTPEEYARIESEARRDLSPGFQVTISRPYYIGKYEVTQGQWKRVMGNNPSVYQGAAAGGVDTDTYPVENVTWSDAQAFIQKLNALEKTRAYRLPTEFEWEYAARAGAEDDITWSDIRRVAFIGGNLRPQPVGKMRPNAWGLYDTLGNVWEWVQDFYNEKIFADPTPARSGREHVLKGGGFIADVKNATYMTHAGGPGSKFDNGFRLAKDPD